MDFLPFLIPLNAFGWRFHPCHLRDWGVNQHKRWMNKHRLFVFTSEAISHPTQYQCTTRLVSYQINHADTLACIRRFLSMSLHWVWHIRKIQQICRLGYPLNQSMLCRAYDMYYSNKHHMEWEIDFETVPNDAILLSKRQFRYCQSNQNSFWGKWKSKPIDRLLLPRSFASMVADAHRYPTNLQTFSYDIWLLTSGHPLFLTGCTNLKLPWTISP